MSENEIKKHPIRVAATRSGTPESTLRAWERRYSAVQPGRADTGRRLYSDRDIERLQLIRQALDGGRSISSVAQLSEADLERLVDEDREARLEATRIGPSGPKQSAAVVDECMEFIKRLDAQALSSTLSRATTRFSALELIEDVIAPLLHRIGTYWYEHQLSPRHEHLAITVVRTALTQLQLGSYGQATRTIVVGTPAGQHHDLGAHFVAALAVTEGWNVVNLGANVPAAEFVMAAREASADVVAVSVVHPADDPGTREVLTHLGEHLDEDVAWIVGGQAAPSYRKEILGAGGREIQSARELSAFLTANRAE